MFRIAKNSEKEEYHMNIKNVYNQLTNVDIEQQNRIWDERGNV